jgi:hypothetical protein
MSLNWRELVHFSEEALASLDICPLDIFEHHVGLPLMAAHLVHLNDVGVL